MPLLKWRSQRADLISDWTQHEASSSWCCWLPLRISRTESLRKREVERHIEKRGYLTLPREFLERAYESKAEPMWKTELAWARKDAKDRGLLNPTAKDEWEISEKSTAKFAFIERDFQSGKLESSRFPLLSTKFFERVGAVK